MQLPLNIMESILKNKYITLLTASFSERYTGSPWGKFTKPRKFTSNGFAAIATHRQPKICLDNANLLKCELTNIN